MNEKLIAEKQEVLGHLQEDLNLLKEEYLNKQKEVASLEDDIELCKLQDQRAAKLLNSLKSEKQKWAILNRIIVDKFVNLEGDCLLAAATIVYLG